MAEKNKEISDSGKARDDFRKELISFMQEKGYVWGPSPEIYGGMAGFYTYAPLGKLLKNKVEKVIRTVFGKNLFWEVECPTVMQKEVWEASGHLGGFSDPVIECDKCKATFRADNLLEEKFPDIQIPTKDEDILKLINEKQIKCPSCKGSFKQEIKRHNLMMKTTIGLDTEAYNRPETATTTYLPFLRYVDFFRKKLPFGVFQIGKAYRNEISPRQYMLRMREFTQAEAQLFIFKADKDTFDRYDSFKDQKMPFWSYQAQKKKDSIKEISLDDAVKKNFLKNKAYAYSLNLAYNLFLEMGIEKERIRLRQHFPDEKAFYADDAWDVEINLKSFGWTEVCGVHDRTDYDLKQHAKFSKKELTALNPENKKEVPNVIEIAFGVDRPLFALLDIFYEKKSKEEGKTVFAVPYHMAPVDLAIYPLLKKNGLPEKAKLIFDDLSKEYNAVFDISGSIGRRYQRAAEQGIPYAITIDFDSLEKEDCTIRDRDSEEQVRVKISNLHDTLKDLFSGKKKFSYLKK
ncbi:MAG: glycine--tRNA ligase [Candidatus Woesearchaeota archaeon]